MMRRRQILQASAHITIFSKGLNIDFFFFFFGFLGLHAQPMEVPRLGVQLELWPLGYTIATAMTELTHICELHHSS